MGLWSFIKGFGGKKVIKGTHTEPKDNNSEWIVLKRRDGTEIMLRPSIDENGNQVCERIFDAITCKMQSVPIYMISSPEVKRIYGCTMRNFLMEVFIENLSDSRYSDFVANELLAPSRIGKIFDQYEGYAGGININDGTLQKGSRPGVVETLKARRLGNEKPSMERKQGEERYTEGLGNTDPSNYADVIKPGDYEKVFRR